MRSVVRRCPMEVSPGCEEGKAGARHLNLTPLPSRGGSYNAWGVGTPVLQPWASK